MITNFNIFKDSEFLKDLFQRLELDYPGLEISIETIITNTPIAQKLTSTDIIQEKDLEWISHKVRFDINQYDLSFADDLCLYVKKCFEFGFKSKKTLEVKLTHQRSDVLFGRNGVIFDNTIDNRKERTDFRSWIWFTSGKDFTDRICGPFGSLTDISEIKSFAIYLYK